MVERQKVGADGSWLTDFVSTHQVVYLFVLLE
jgi:hypothetical protein